MARRSADDEGGAAADVDVRAGAQYGHQPDDDGEDRAYRPYAAVADTIQCDERRTERRSTRRTDDKAGQGAVGR